MNEQQKVMDELAEQMRLGETELAQLLRKLISFRTQTQNPKNLETKPEAKACLEFVDRWLADYGFQSETWMVENQVHGELPIMLSVKKGKGNGRSIALNGHLDVVPAGSREAWKHDPFAGVIEDGKIYGRGASDMKSGVAAAMMAVALVERAGYDLLGDVQFHLVTDEEVVGIGTRDIIEKAESVDAVIGNEPTDMTFSPAAPGLEHLRIEIEGKSRHAGVRYAEIYDEYHGDSVNAIEKGLKIIDALHALERKWGKEKYYPLLPRGFNTILPGLIVGGMGGGHDGMLNQIINPGTTPDYCSIEYNIWYYPGEDLADIKKEIVDSINEMCSKDAWLRMHPPKLTWALRGISFPPMDTPLTHELLKIFDDALGLAEREPRMLAFEAAADLSWYTVKGIPSVLFGPAKISNAHSANEYVDLSELYACALVLATVLAQWCGVQKRL